MDVTQPQRLGLARPIDGEGIDPALGKIYAREDHAHFLGVVHAVEQHDGRAPAAARAGHEVGRQTRVLVRHLDALDLGMEALQGGVICAQRLAIHRHLLRAGRDEALGAVIAVARAHVMVAGGDLASFSRRSIGDGGDAVRHRSPFLPPHLIEVGFPRARLKTAADAIDFVDGNGRVGCHALDDLHGIGPPQIAGKMHRPALCLRRRALDHGSSPP